MDEPDFGQLLKYHLQKQKRTQKWLAEKIDYSHQNISKWVKYGFKPDSLEVVVQIADELDIEDVEERKKLFKAAGYVYEQQNGEPQQKDATTGVIDQSLKQYFQLYRDDPDAVTESGLGIHYSFSKDGNISVALRRILTWLIGIGITLALLYSSPTMVQTLRELFNIDTPPRPVPLDIDPFPFDSSVEVSTDPFFMYYKLSDLIEEDPEDPYPLILRAVFFLLPPPIARPELVIQDLSYAIELNPEDAEAYFYRAIAYGIEEKYQHAIYDLSTAIPLSRKIDTNGSFVEVIEMANLYRGYAQLGKGQDYGLAILDLTHYIDSDSRGYEIIDSHFHRAMAYLLEGKIDLAISDFSQAISADDYLTPRLSDSLLKHDPYYVRADAYFYRGVAHFLQGNNEAALQDFKTRAEYSFGHQNPHTQANYGPVSLNALICAHGAIVRDITVEVYCNEAFELSEPIHADRMLVRIFAEDYEGALEDAEVTLTMIQNIDESEMVARETAITAAGTEYLNRTWARMQEEDRDGALRYSKIVQTFLRDMDESEPPAMESAIATLKSGQFPSDIDTMLDKRLIELILGYSDLLEGYRNDYPVKLPFFTRNVSPFALDDLRKSQ